MSSRLLAALLLLGLLQNAAPSSQDQFQTICSRPPPVMGCPDGWNRMRSNACIKVFMENKTFDEAEHHCVSLGSHLVSIRGGFEFSVVLCLFVQTVKGRTPFWIGAHYNEQERRWKWTDGTSFSFINWLWTLTGDENNACVEMNNTVWVRWKNMNCDLKQFYVCMKQS